MEGDDVVAIVRNSQHAGLSVTLIPKTYKIKSGIDKDPNGLARSNVETNTDRTIQNFSTFNVKFTSSCYQLSSCIRPSFARSSSFSHQIRAFVRDPFAESLRKYPTVTSSADFIQKILKHTQMRHRKRSYLKSLCRVIKPKNQQTHTLIKSFDKGVNTTEERYSNTRRSSSQPSIKRKSSSQTELQNYTYDYLKGDSLVSNVDVRFFNDAKRAVCGKLLEIIEKKPMMCPMLKYRYAYHKKYGNCTKTSPINSSQHEEQKVTLRQSVSTNMIDNYFKRKSCFSLQPSTCDHETKTNKNLEAQAPGDFKKYNDHQNNILFEVKEWIKNLPVYPSFSDNDKQKQEKLVHKLVQTLKMLETQPNFVTKAKTEILQCLQDLPMWRPNDSEEENVFLDKTANMLIAKLISLAESKFKKKVSHEIKCLPFKNNSVNDSDIEEITDIFISKLKSIALNRTAQNYANKENFKSVITDLLKDLPLKFGKAETINKLASDIADQLCYIPLYASKSDNEILKKDIDHFQNKIFTWLKDIPELFKKDIDECADLLNCFTKKLLYNEIQNIHKDIINRRLQKDVKELLDVIAARTQTFLNSKRKNELHQELLAHILRAIDNMKNLSSDDSSDIPDPIMRWFLSIPGLSDRNNGENKKDLLKLVKILKEIQMSDNHFESLLPDMQRAISDWLRHLLEKINMKLDPRVQENLVNKLILKLNNTPKHISKYDYDKIHQTVENWLKNISEIGSNIEVKLKNIIEAFINVISDLNLDVQIMKAIRDFVDLLSNNIGQDISTQQKQSLEQKLLEQVKTLRKPRKRWNNQNRPSPSMFTEVKNILNNCFDILKERIPEHLKNKLTEEIHNTLVPKPEWDEIFTKVTTILTKETQLNDDIIQKLGREIVTRVKSKVRSFEDVPIYIAAKSFSTQCDHSNNRFSPTSLATNEIKQYEYLAPRPVKKRNDTNTEEQIKEYKTSSAEENNNNSSQILRNIQMVSENILNKEITSSKNSIGNRHISSEEKSIQIEVALPESLSMNRVFAASTPVNNFSSTSYNKMASPMKKISDHALYLKQLKPFVYDWLKKNNISDNELEIIDLVNNIAADYLERQRYIQLSGMETTEKDELEYLKYQIYKRLFLSNIPDRLPVILTKVNDLNDKLKTIKIAELTKQSNKSNNRLNIPDKTHIPIQDTGEFVVENFTGAILDWLNIYKPFSRSIMKNINLLENISFSLARALIEVLDNNPNVSFINLEELLLQEIINKIKIIFGYNSNNSYKTAQNLIHYLKQIQLFHNISERIPVEINNTDEHSYFDNIRETVINWAKMLSLEPKKTFEDIKFTVDNLVEAISANLLIDINVIEDCLWEDIMKFLNIIPLKIHYQRLSKLQEYTKQLINAIKSSINYNNNVFKRKQSDLNVSDKRIPENFRNIIKSWCEYLPVSLGCPEEAKENIEVRHNIESEIINILDKLYLENESYQFGSLMREEINKILKNIPMSKELKKCLELFTNMLIEKLKTARSENLRDKKNSNYRRLLHETINQSLSLINNPSITKQMSFDLLKEKLADTFIDLHYATHDAEIRLKFKNKLINEIDKFCRNYLRENQSAYTNPKKIQEDLDKALKNVSVPNVTTIEANGFQIPPSTLSNEYIDHLQKIKARAHIRAQGQPKLRKDASTNPLPVDIAMQTEMNETTEKHGLWQDISPQVVIKEYYWDSNESKQSIQIFVPSVISQNTEPQTSKPCNAQTDKITQTETKTTHDTLNEIYTSQTPPETKETSRTITHTVDIFQQSSNTMNDPADETQNDLQSYVLSNKIGKPNTNDEIANRIFNNINTVDEVDGMEQIATKSERRDIPEDIFAQDKNFKPSFNTLDSMSRYRNINCSCRSRMLSKCRNRTYFDCHHSNFKHCAKCYGDFCPHPSNFFFKRDL